MQWIWVSLGSLNVSEMCVERSCTAGGQGTGTRITCPRWAGRLRKLWGPVLNHLCQLIAPLQLWLSACSHTIRRMFSMYEDDTRKGGWLLALCLFIVPPYTHSCSGIYFSSFTASGRYSHLFFGAQSKTTWSKLVSLGLYCFLLYCAPTHFPVLQQNGRPSSYRQTYRNSCKGCLCRRAIYKKRGLQMWI